MPTFTCSHASARGSNRSLYARCQHNALEPYVGAIVL